MRTRATVLALAVLAATGFGYAVQAQQTVSAAKVVVYKSPT